MSDKIYGFDFVKQNSGGFGASIYMVLLAYHYAKCNQHQFAFVEEGKKMKELNGSIVDTDEPEKYWHSYFRSFEFLPREKIFAVWNDCPNGWKSDTPIKPKIEWYSLLLKEMYLLRDDIKEEVDKLVKRSNFDAQTDIVLHIRRSDKIFSSKGSKPESGELSLDEYVSETMKIVDQIQKKCRIFLITDDIDIYEEMKSKFARYDIETIWDENEKDLQLRVEQRLNKKIMSVQAAKLAGEITYTESWEQNLITLKILEIMSRALYLVGGRMSYLFRVGELLRYPLKTHNIKDNDIFGKAEYADPSEPIVNPMLPRRYLNPISAKYENLSDEEWNVYAQELDDKYIIRLPDFMEETVANEVFASLLNYPAKWYTHAIYPDECLKVVYLDIGSENVNKYVDYARSIADRGFFAYSFKRTFHNHYDTCFCFSCRLRATFESREVHKILSKITGKKVTGLGETFVSKYERGDFLTIHHDKNKGSYAFILSLTKDWCPAYGGLTHFYDSESNTIYKTLVPCFNTLTIFKLSPEKQIDHFVSEVTGPNSRITYTGWFNVI